MEVLIDHPTLGIFWLHDAHVNSSQGQVSGRTDDGFVHHVALAGTGKVVVSAELIKEVKRD